MVKHPALIGGLLLGLFGVIGSALVALTYNSTAERIDQNQRDALLGQISTLVPADELDNDILADTQVVQAPDALGAPATTVYRGRRNGQVSAVVLSPVIAPDGYNGAIRLIIGVHADGTLAGVRVLGHRETPGLGDKVDASRSDWITRFAGLGLDNLPDTAWKVKKDGGHFDQFTGATITPRAVVKAVKKALDWVADHRAELFGRDDRTEQQS